MRLPLYARILLWFLLNVAVIGVALGLVMRAQLRHGLDSFVGSFISAKLQAEGERMYQQLSTTPQVQWDEVVREVEAAHGVKAELRRGPSDHLAGTKLALPESVTNDLILRSARGPGPQGNRPPPPPPRGDGPPPGPQDEEGGPADFRDGPPRPERPAANLMPTQYGKLLARAGDPGQYWAIIMVPPPRGTSAGPRQPIVYIINTSSIFTGSLLFDVKPWLISIGAALGFSALLWLPLVRGITGKVKETMRATEQMAQGKFDVRIKENRGDELGRLAHAVNSMAQQLDGYVTGQRRFTGDIAHELCSPISRMQAALGILEIRASDDKQRHYIETLSDELQHMSHLVQELLQFSRASLHRELTITDVNLASLAHEVAARDSTGYPDDAVQIEIPDDLTARAEPELLARALGNVIRNALHYAGDAGSVTIAAASREGHIVITISDHGPGVPDAALPKLFDPFFRPDAERSRDHGGTGLGLAIVKSCIEACRGSVSAKNRELHGLEIELVLPQAAKAQAAAGR